MIKFKTDYQIIEHSCLPDDVQDELIAACPTNDSGLIINPEYYPRFKAWLIEQEVPVICYIIWWSW